MRRAEDQPIRSVPESEVAYKLQSKWQWRGTAATVIRLDSSSVPLGPLVLIPNERAKTSHSLRSS